MFEITSDDIAALNDKDLRSLIGLLCESTLRRAGLPASAATWGGDQTAKDGGLDVRVALPAGTKIEGFVPRAATGFQVKKPDMPAGEIPKEMKPKGVLRPVIKNLAAEDGAYIIVSSNGSTADFALTNRREAMGKAVRGSKNAARLHLDFYDRNRVATWVRDHPGLIPWVRTRIGKSIAGWKSYGDWSLVPAGADNSYLLDDKARIKTSRSDDGDGLSTVDGINRIRDPLRNPGQVVRLVGLSGVGKTRLVEALFDNAVGTNALDPSLAIYTNVADEPDPQPRGLASDLIAAGTRAILVIDNCPPETHKHLSDVARASGSTVSAITIEYDIRDDQPEGTDVFSLETSSLPLIEKLVARRFPELSRADVERIADFSGGNARIALALAGTVQKAETVSGLSDADLFKRLFQQRHEYDAGLSQIAEACSLVYSFQGEALAGEDAELPLLGSLVGKSGQDVFKAAAELKRRDLLQQRGVWRAILPHAIANRLAALALENIPYTVIDATLVQGSSERLLRSFSRRLGYLDSSKEAQAIVRGWLAPGGLLSDVPKLSDLRRAVLQNVAPVVPAAALSALENAFANADKDTLLSGQGFIRLLYAFAYDPALFERSTALLRKFAAARGEGDLDHDAAKALVPLFQIAFSGTHAPLASRLNVACDLLKSAKPVEQQLGVMALEAMLKSEGFMPFSNAEFGARSRNYGYHPKDGKEVDAWFGTVLRVAQSFATEPSPIMARVQKAIAKNFRGLWVNGRQFEALERISSGVAGNGFWRDGWVAVRQTQHFKGKILKPESHRRLAALEEFLRPKDLANRVRGQVLGDGNGRLYLEDFEDDADMNYTERSRRTAETVKELGKLVAIEDGVFTELSQEIVCSKGPRFFDFGRGLAAGAKTPTTIWTGLTAVVAAAEDPNVLALCGFLQELQAKDSASAQKLLDEAVDHPVLGKWLVELQTSVTIDQAGVERLRRALELGRATIGHFYSLMYGRNCDPIPGPAFRDLLLAINAKPGGHPVALEVLGMRLHSDGGLGQTPMPETIEAGRILLEQHVFERRSGHESDRDHTLGIVAKSCLKGSGGAPVALKLWRDLKAAIEKYDVYPWEQDDLLQALFSVQPITMLDELVAGDGKDRDRNISIIQDTNRHHPNPVGAIPDDIVLSWCNDDPGLRYPFAAGATLLFDQVGEPASLQWRPIAKALLERSPDPVAVFTRMTENLWPLSFDGSFATEFERRLQLLDRLDIGDNPALVAVFLQARTKLAAAVDDERRRELAEDRAESGRFE